MKNRAIILIAILFLLATTPVVVADSFTDQAFSTDRTYTIKSTTNSTVWLFEKENSTPTWSYNLQGEILCAAISPDDNYFAIGSGGGKIWLFDRKGTVLWNKTFGNAGIKSIVFSEDSRYLDASSFMNQAFYLSIEGKPVTRPRSTTVTAAPSATISAAVTQMPAEVDLSWIQSVLRNNLILVLAIVLGLCIAGISWYTGSRRQYKQTVIIGSAGNIVSLKNLTILSIILVAAGGLLTLYAPANYGDFSKILVTFGIAGLLIAYCLYAVIVWGNDDKLLAVLMLAIPLSVYYFSTSTISGQGNIILTILLTIAVFSVISAILLFISDKIRGGLSHGRIRYSSTESSYVVLGIIVVSFIMASMGSTTILSENTNSIFRSTTEITAGSHASIPTKNIIAPVTTQNIPAPLPTLSQETKTLITATQPTPRITTVPVTTINYETGLTSRSFTYYLRGKAAPAYADMYSGLSTRFSSKSAPLYCVRYNYDKTPCSDEEKRQYFLKYLDEPDQKKSLDSLVKSIESKTSNKDDQARIAISLVQQIPYDYSTFNKLSSSATSLNERMRYPYETLYQNKGVCSEKSLVLAYLLRELGYGVVLFEYPVENHMVVGIKSPAQYDYDNSGYAFVETAAPAIPTDSQCNYVGVGKLTHSPDTFLVSEGRSFDSISEEYNDAQHYHALLAMGQVLDEYSYYQWLSLVQKYGMSSGFSSSQSQTSQSYSGTCNINLGRYCSAGLNCCERDNLCYLPCSRGTWIPSECVCVG